MDKRDEIIMDLGGHLEEFPYTIIKDVDSNLLHIYFINSITKRAMVISDVLLMAFLSTIKKEHGAHVSIHVSKPMAMDCEEGVALMVDLERSYDG